MAKSALIVFFSAVLKFVLPIKILVLFIIFFPDSIIAIILSDVIKSTNSLKKAFFS